MQFPLLLEEGGEYWEFNQVLDLRYYFLDNINMSVSIGKVSIFLCVFFVLALNSKTPSNPVSQFFSDYRQGIAYKKGLTFQATVWPSEQNSFVGRMSCNGCNPQLGDTSCT